MTDIINLDHERKIRHFVKLAKTCPLTGEVLDVRTCAVLTSRSGDPIAVLSPTAAEQIAADPVKSAALDARGVTLTTR